MTATHVIGDWKELTDREVFAFQQNRIRLMSIESLREFVLSVDLN